MMNIEHKYQEILAQLKTDMESAVADAADKVYGEMLPYVEGDTFCNTVHRAQNAIDNMLAGRFNKNSDGVITIDVSDGMTIRINITANQYDNIRKRLIEVMDNCPKDLEIKALKDQIKSMQERGMY